MQIIAVKNHLRLITRLGASQTGIKIEVFGPGEIRAELQAFVKAFRDVGLQGVIATVAFGKPKETNA